MNRKVSKLIKLIQKNLSPDLLLPKYREQTQPFGGHCYIASEALFHMLGKIGTPMNVKVHGISHWYLRGPNGEIWDPTAEQFDRIPYGDAKGRGFLTKTPSKRALKLIGRINGGLSKNYI